MPESTPHTSARLAIPEFDDPEKFVKVPNVPIFAENCRYKKRFDADGKEEIYRECVDANQLQIICDNSRKREESGEIPQVLVGHTDPGDEPETRQPPTAGFARNFRMGELDDRSVILVDYYIRKPLYENELLLEYPRRSAEVFRKMRPDAFIDIISLLKRKPQIDLGLVTHASEEKPETFSHCEGGSCECPDCSSKEDHSMAEGKKEPDDCEVIDRPGLIFDNEHERAGAHKMLNHLMKMAKSDKTGGVKKEDAPPTPTVHDYNKELAPVVAEPFEASVPSGTNTEPPAMAGIEKPAAATAAVREDEMKPETFRQKYEDLLINFRSFESRLAALENENKSLRATNNEVTEKFRLSERERELVQVRAEGYIFDRAEQLELTKGYSPEQFAAHLGMIRKNFTKSSVGEPLIPVGSFADTGGNTLTKPAAESGTINPGGLSEPVYNDNPFDDADVAVEQFRQFQTLRFQPIGGKGNQRGDAALQKAQSAVQEAIARAAEAKKNRGNRAV